MQDDLLTAIEILYDCADTTFDYQRALETLGNYTDDTAYMIGTVKFPGTIKSYAHHRFPDEAVEAVTKKRWNGHSHKFIQLFPQLPVATPVIRRTMHSDEDFFTTELYHETCKPWGIHSEGTCILHKGLLGGTAMSFARLPGQTGINHELLSRIFILAKHLARAMQLHSRFSRLEEALILSNNTLDLVEHGLVLYSEAGEFLYANSAARRLFEAQDGLQFNNGVIAISNREARDKFAALMEELVAPDKPLSARTGGYVKVPRRSFRRSYGLMAVPLGEASCLDFERVGYAVFIFNPDRNNLTASRFFASVFELTPAEAQLAIELAQGTSVDNYMKAYNVTRNTVKTHLRSLFEKTGTSRQPEMVSVLLRSMAGINLTP